MIICEYGCGQEAKHQFKNGKWCCCEIYQQCSVYRNLVSKQVYGENNPNYGIKISDEKKRKISKSLKGKLIGEKNPFFGKTHSDESKAKISLSNKGKKHNKSSIQKNIKSRLFFNIKKIKKKYPLFYKIEQVRYNPYNPYKPEEKEIQVRCKNHNCPNSKEQGGWFTPKRIQLYERIRQVEKDYGNGGSYFYCSNACKKECPLYNLRSDPFQKTEKLYTQDEYNQFRNFVLNRDDYICQFCGTIAKHVHHERPQKLEPFFSLDPDFSWSCCEKCHYEKGHKDECSTGKLANIICIN